MTTKDEARAERTRKLIAHFNRAFGDKAWTKLHAILCMSHPFSCSEDTSAYEMVENLFDSMLIAQELDRQNAAALTGVKP